jgi:glycosidase
MQRFLSILSIAIVLSCTKKVPDFEQVALGLASPFQLKGDTTVFYLSDYVIESAKIDSIIFPSGISKIRLNDSVFQLIRAGNLNPLTLICLETKCGKEYIPLLNRKKQKVTLQYKGLEKFKHLKVIGSMNNWNRDNKGMKRIDGVWQQEFSLTSGVYEYLFYSEGREFKDPENDESRGNNSLLKVGKYLPEDLPFITTESFGEKGVTLSANKHTTQITGLWQNKLLQVVEKDDKYLVEIPIAAKKISRSYLRLYASNEKNIGNDILVPLHFGEVITEPKQLTRTDKHSMIMYFLMVDRFFNGDSLNDEPVNDPEIHPKANYYGGDLGGVYEKLKDGYFADLGINTLWLSPITQNPKTAYGLYPEPRTKFSGYHGYWPVSNIKIDHRFGTKDELSLLVNSVHQKQMNILLDYVANHIHQEHPVYQEHPDWATSLYLPDGSLNTEKWDEQRLTTWFDTFLPTLDLQRKEVVDAMVDSAIFWLKEYNIDGFRHDATKHIDELYWRTLTNKIKRLKGNTSFFQIGETYGSPLLISSYISSGMLDAQFDFNTYDNAVACFAQKKESFERLKSVLTESWKYYGYNHLMGNISGNQDRARFISYAGEELSLNEDTKYAGWNREIGVGNAESYKRLNMLHAFNMTIPGIPVIYYGDEIGMPGGNDPDNRRMMRFEDLTDEELKVKETVKKLIQIRKNNMALLYGHTKILQADNELFVYTRKYFNQNVLIIFNKSNMVKKQSYMLQVRKDNPVSEFGSNVKKGEQSLHIEIQPISFDIIHL